MFRTCIGQPRCTRLTVQTMIEQSSPWKIILIWLRINIFGCKFHIVLFLTTIWKLCSFWRYRSLNKSLLLPSHCEISSIILLISIFCSFFLCLETKIKADVSWWILKIVLVKHFDSFMQIQYFLSIGYDFGIILLFLTLLNIKICLIMKKTIFGLIISLKLSFHEVSKFWFRSFYVKFLFFIKFKKVVK